MCDKSVDIANVLCYNQYRNKSVINIDSADHFIMIIKKRQVSIINMGEN